MSSVQVEVEDCISETAKFDTVYQRTKHIQQVLVKVKPKVQHDDSSSADRNMHRFGFENGIQQHNKIMNRLDSVLSGTKTTPFFTRQHSSVSASGSHVTVSSQNSKQSGAKARLHMFDTKSCDDSFSKKDDSRPSRRSMSKSILKQGF